MSNYSDWAEETYTIFKDLPPDIQENIKSNRDKLKSQNAKARKLKKLKDHEAFRLCYELEHYFDDGYMSTENIDDLPEKVEKALLAMIEEG